MPPPHPLMPGSIVAQKSRQFTWRFVRSIVARAALDKRVKVAARGSTDVDSIERFISQSNDARNDELRAPLRKLRFSVLISKPNRSAVIRPSGEVHRSDVQHQIDDEDA